MKRTRWGLVLLLGLWLAGPACADPASDLADQARVKAQTRDYKGALNLYQQSLKLAPDKVDVLYNASVAAQGADQLPLAVQFLEHAHQVDAHNTDVECRLVLVYQAMGRSIQAEEMANTLCKDWRSTPAMQKNANFGRDHFEYKGHRYDVHQSYNPDPMKGEHLYDFVELDPGGKPIRDFIVFLDASASRADTAAQHHIVEDWVWAMVQPPSLHVQYLVLHRKPTYIQAQQMFVQVWDGTLKTTLDRKKS